MSSALTYTLDRSLFRFFFDDDVGVSPSRAFFSDHFLQCISLSSTSRALPKRIAFDYNRVCVSFYSFR